MPRRARILLAGLVAGAALYLPHSVAQASPLPCQGYGGQGPGGYVSSLVVDCLHQLGQ